MWPVLNVHSVVYLASIVITINYSVMFIKSLSLLCRDIVWRLCNDDRIQQCTISYNHAKMLSSFFHWASEIFAGYHLVQATSFIFILNRMKIIPGQLDIYACILYSLKGCQPESIGWTVYSLSKMICEFPLSSNNIDHCQVLSRVGTWFHVSAGNIDFNKLYFSTNWNWDFDINV